MATERTACIFWPVLALASFTLHFVWEYLQCAEFFVHQREPATLGAMLRATLGDLVLTVLAWAGTALATWDRRWALRRWTPRAWLALVVLAIALSVTIELHALAMGWWFYTDRTPLLPLTPVSALPVLQLLLLFPLSFGLARAFALRRTPLHLFIGHDVTVVSGSPLARATQEPPSRALSCHSSEAR
ncbi:MAG: hypothetical protein VYC42_16630 [Pseudomonadota bacterium]|nr:hypothetical protein [Nevskiales bacterium]MEC9364846.1 hypothetical protein [Pseudomonadota bacterium]